MNWAPISLLTPQFQNPTDNTPYSGSVLKAYRAGTTTNILMATDATGGTTFTSVALNASGVPEHNGAVIIPHIEEAYKIVLYFTQADADADTTANAVFVIDELTPTNITNDFSLEDAVSNAASDVITVTHTTTGTPVIGIGTGIGFETETVAGTHLGMNLNSVATNVTGGTEAFKFVVQLMTGGATATDIAEIDAAGVMKFLKANPQLLGGDTNGVLLLGNGATSILGGAVKLYGDTHTTKAGFIEFLVDDVVKAHFDPSASKWVFDSTLEITGLKGTGAVTITNILDEDDLVSDSATALATQQSIKAYVDSFIVGMGTYNSETFTSSGTWTKPSATTAVRYTLVAGGGAGGGGSSSLASGGGGGGGGVESDWIAVTDDITVTIGAGGAGSLASSGAAGSNSTLSVGAVATAYGGNGGSGNSSPVAATAGSAGGTGSTGTGGSGGGGGGSISGGTDSISANRTGARPSSTTSGTSGGYGSQSGATAGSGGRGQYGYGGGGGGGSSTTPGNGLDGGGDGGSAADGVAGTANTGGGGGGSGEDGATGTGGAGGSGVCIIEWWT